MPQGNELTHQQKIDMINGWVQDFFDGDREAGDKLLKQFEPFLNSSCNRFMRHYQGVFDRDAAMQEARMIFYDLLMEYTIGGTAYFNVYMQRKLPLRLRYCFIKEIKRRTRDLSHSDEQFSANGLDGVDHAEYLEEVLSDDDNRYLLGQIEKAIELCELTDRERDMLVRFIDGENRTSIAKSYGISRSRTSIIIKNVVEKIQSKITVNGKLINEGDV